MCRRPISIEHWPSRERIVRNALDGARLDFEKKDETKSPKRIV